MKLFLFYSLIKIILNKQIKDLILFLLVFLLVFFDNHANDRQSNNKSIITKMVLS